VRSFSEITWFRTTKQKTIDSGILLCATGVSHLMREKRKKSSDDAATDGDLGTSVMRSNVAWFDKIEHDGPRKTAEGNCCQLPEAKKAKKIE